MRMKASGVSTSSTFWLINPYNKKKGGKRTELDIIECIGNAQRWPSFRTHMHSNTHITVFPEDKGAEPVTAKQGNNIKLETPVDEAFHTYGCWWVDANTMRFYHDGEYVYTINPPTDFDETPFDQLMFVNLVCEIYDWEVPPAIEGLLDDSRNTTLYDYVRAYKLVKVEESK